MKIHLSPALIYPALAIGAMLITYTAITVKSSETCQMAAIQPLAWQNERRSMNVELSQSYLESIGIRCH